MKIDLNKREIEYLKKLFDYNDFLGTSHVVMFEEMTIFDKILEMEEIKDMTIIEAIEKLQEAVKKNSGVSKTIDNFLKSLTCEHKLNIANFCELDNVNFAAVQILINAMKTEDRFTVWNILKEQNNQKICI